MPSPGSSLQIPPDARDLLRAFSDREVRFLVVGAHALGYWGQPRATGDFDLLVEPTEANAHRVWSALVDFGAPMFNLTLDDLARPGVVFQMGAPPYRIDLSNELSGVTFEEAWLDHGIAQVEDLRIPVIGREAFVRNKRSAGRPKDLLDLQLLGEL